MATNSILKINCFLSNLNLIVSLIGYVVFTSIMFPIVGDISETTSLTVPFRLFTLILALIVILLNIRVKLNTPRGVKVFFFFWVLVIIRMLFDLEFSEFVIPLQFRQRLWLYSIGLTFVPMISIVKSARNIDMDICMKWIYILLSISLIITFFLQVDNSSMDERISGSIALDSISFSNSAVFLVILSLYYLINGKNKTIRSKIVFCFILLLSLYTALRAGSRGPIVSLIVVVTFWYISKDHNILRALIKFAVIVGLFLISFKIILGLISKISPVLASRFDIALGGDDLSMLNRYESYEWFISEIIENPILGSHFARLQHGMFPGYAHNLFLDILLGFGIIGLAVFLYVLVKAVNTTRKSIIKDQNYWIGLLMLQSLILSISSGAYYTNPILNISIVASIMLLSDKAYKRKLQVSINKNKNI